MHMIEKITKAVQQEINIRLEEAADFQQLMEEAVRKAKQAKLDMTEERWLRLGVHMVGLIRRVNSGELLAAVDDFVREQVDADMQELSKEVLGASQLTASRQNDSTEVVLLALHFAAARQNF